MEDAMAARSTLLFLVFVVGAAAASLLDGLEKTDVREIRTRLEEEKAKRLLLQNDLEVLMLKFEQLERTCKGSSLSNFGGKTTNIRIAFAVQLSAHTEFDKHHVIKFDHVITNHGNGYSPNTGAFRAPLQGTYVFSLTLMSRSKGRYVHANMMKNGTLLGRVFAGEQTSAWPDTGAVTVVVDLEKDDDVFVQEYNGNAALHGDKFCSFTGFLLQ